MLARALVLALGTQPNHAVLPGRGRNPGGARAPYHGNGELWTVLPDRGVVREARDKAGGIDGPLKIVGHRLDAPAAALRARVPGGCGSTGFQASGLSYPTPGCWKVTGSVGRANLTFITLVVPAGGA